MSRSRSCTIDWPTLELGQFTPEVGLSKPEHSINCSDHIQQLHVWRPCSVSGSGSLPCRNNNMYIQYCDTARMLYFYPRF